MLIAVALLLANFHVEPQPAARVPATIDASRGTAKPVWVAAEVAIDEGGALRRELFEPHQLTYISELERGATTGPCAVNLGAPPLEQFVRMDSLEALVRSSRRIIFGTLTDSREGFFRGIAGTLYLVTVDDSVAARAVPVTTYLFLPTARIETRHGSICMNPPADAISVEVGDRVLLFVHLPPVGKNEAIHVIDPRLQVVAERGGKLHAPARLALPADRGIKEIMNQVRGLRFAEEDRR